MASNGNEGTQTDTRQRPTRGAAYVSLIPYTLPLLLLLVLAVHGQDARGVALAVHMWSFVMVSFGQFGGVSHELVQERISSMSSPRSKSWDKLVVDVYGPLFSLLPFLLYMFFPSRLLFHTALWWPTALALSGTAIFFACMRENDFFSTVVRIQKDRQHQVCDSGLYAIVRHPSYVGLLLGSIGLMVSLRVVVLTESKRDLLSLFDRGVSFWLPRGP